MSRTRKYGGLALLFAALLLVLQAGASLLVKTRPVRGFLTERLQTSFGRPLQADNFSIQLLPLPELEIDRVTIGEDPAFGREYFLRAERMTAGLRWTGLLRGRFQFGTMSLTRPSLILVRNADGRWNLEGWLPPAGGKAEGTGGASAGAGGKQAPAESTHHLRTIEFDDGRINFKMGDEKRAFAFINVSGSVEQVAEGRWRLRLEAEPWRSGVPLQSTGTLQVVGDVAGTSARLQPAEIHVHWAKVSLADVFRLVTGNDSGVRGEVVVDGNASVGMGKAEGDAGAGVWRFAVQARGTQLHRWDLTERSDNPRVNVNVKGEWNLAKNEARAEELRVELPGSNLNGTAVLQTASPGAWQVQFKSMGVQGEDLLAWCRAFRPGMAEEVAVRDFMSGNVTLSGWPLRWEEGALESRGGALVIPGLKVSRVESFRGALHDGKFSVEGLRVRLGADANAPAVKGRVATAGEDLVEFAVNEDAETRQGSVKLNLRLAEAARFFKLTNAFGRRLEQGWEYSGGASGLIAWNWEKNAMEARRSGSMELNKAKLEIAGLNLPVKIEEARLDWKDGKRAATIAKAEGFGASWSGTIAEASETSVAASESADVQNHWRFQLHADRLDAAELDRWFGPRARPNWLQRLLTGFLGQSSSTAKGSELLRRVSAEGELTAETLTVEKIKLTKARGVVQFRDLRLQVKDMSAQWAGGSVQGEMTAEFTPAPHYEVTADVDHANLAQLPWAPRWAERWGGTASGTIQLSTGGVGREELLRQLSGQGDVRLSRIELRGWDVRASAESGVARAGISRWNSGQGRFEIGDQEVRFEGIQLEGPPAHTQLSGTLGFDMSGQVTFLPEGDVRRVTKVAQTARGLSLSGPLETPKVAVETVNAETRRP